MLSYQHIYHAGNAADVHKHGALSICLTQLAAKPKPMTIMETHAGRGVYDLSGPEARKTGEAKLGINQLIAEGRIASDHPYLQAVAATRQARTAEHYPGSPAIARHFMRPGDHLHLMELHPAEYRTLTHNMRGPELHIHRRDGYEGVLAISPPTPRRGLVLIDPAYEIKTEYQDVARFVPKLIRKWPEACVMVWYPLLTNHRHIDMVAALKRRFPDHVLSEVSFRAMAPGHRMRGSGLFILNMPYGAGKQLKAYTDSVFI
ncbi:MAG: 23S rRNA (adenine(2030)-N(6))-methyltransferase RlmJ [Alphaproteobacteria bacterium]